MPEAAVIFDMPAARVDEVNNDIFAVEQRATEQRVAGGSLELADGISAAGTPRENAIRNEAWGFSPDPMDMAIKHHSISLEVDDFNAAIAAIGRLPGHSIHSSQHSFDDRHSYNAARSVRAADYERTKEELRLLGKVMHDHTSAQIVFNDIIDLSARIRAKEVEIARLYELLERSDTVTAMVQIARQLDSGNSELDNLRSQRGNLERGIADATISIHIFERPPEPRYEPAFSFGERLRNSFISSLNFTFGFIDGTAIFVSSIGFPLLIIGVIGFVVYIYVRRRGRENEQES
jgi:hypothetical protein